MENNIEELKKDIKHLTNVLQVAKMQMERGAYDSAQGTINEGIYYACLNQPFEELDGFIVSDLINAEK